MGEFVALNLSISSNKISTTISGGVLKFPLAIAGIAIDVIALAWAFSSTFLTKDRKTCEIKLMRFKCKNEYVKTAQGGLTTLDVDGVVLLSDINSQPIDCCMDPNPWR